MHWFVDAVSTLAHTNTTLVAFNALAVLCAVGRCRSRCRCWYAVGLRVTSARPVLLLARDTNLLVPVLALVINAHIDGAVSVIVAV